MHVVATAGHVDHGKSTLVRALTGMEPDRWAEERRRGLSIGLGFAWTRLPGGEVIAFVDVPGHERFVGTMLAGVGPVPAVLFVVAADEGWMPQSQEHLDALDGLGVGHGLLAVTRSDLAPPGPATEQALERLGRSSLGRVEAVAVSGTTGAGLDSLRTALAGMVSRLPSPDHRAAVRLWVDRAFTVRGAGTVVTGTLPAGSLRVGETLEVVPGGRSVRVRGLQTLHEPAATVAAVARVAVNLRGVPVSDVPRGHALVTPDRWTVTDQVDVRVASAPTDGLPRAMLCHLGSASVAARVRVLGTDTARLRLHRPLPMHQGDRLLLRDPGNRRVLGAVALDVRPPALSRRGDAAARARQLAGMTGMPDPDGEVRRRGLVRAGDLRAFGVEPPAGRRVAGEWVADPEYWAALRVRLAEVVAAHAAAHPLDPGMPLDAARRLVGVPERRLVEALVAPPLALRDGCVVADGRTGSALPEAVAAAVAELRRDLDEAPFAAPDAGRLAALGLDRRALAAAVRTGVLMRVAEGVYLLPGTDDEAARRLAALPQPFTAGEARQALGSTRRVVVPLLEHLDRAGATERVDEAGRRRVPSARVGSGSGLPSPESEPSRHQQRGEA